MILYSSPLACSVAAHLVLVELGLPHEVRYVDIYAQPHVLIEDGAAFSTINPKDAVPALQLETGEVLTEIGVILQYLGDQVPESDLLPRAGSLARYRVMEWLSYIGSDVHKSIGPLFNPRMPEAGKQVHRDNLHRRLSHVDQVLSRQPYLAGERFTVADAYLFVMIGWAPYFKFDPAPYRHVLDFHARVAVRPSFDCVRRLIEPALARVKLPVFPEQP